MAAVVVLIVKKVARVRVQEVVELALGLLALPVPLGKLWEGSFRPPQDTDEVGPGKDTTAAAASLTVIAEIGVDGFHVHGRQLGGNGGSRPGISSSVGDLFVAQGKSSPVTGTSVSFLGQVDPQDKLAESLEAGFVGNCGRPLGHNLVVLLIGDHIGFVRFEFFIVEDIGIV